MSGSSAVPILCATCGLEIVGTMWWHESDPLNRYCERCGVPSPTPAAPAGSGWLTVQPHEAPYQVQDSEAWYGEAVAQRRRAEAAERERDECLWRERHWQADFEDRLAALTASREREGKLVEAIQPFLHPDLRRTLGGNTVGDDSPVFGRDNAVLTLGDFRRLAALSKGGADA